MIKGGRTSPVPEDNIRVGLLDWHQSHSHGSRPILPEWSRQIRPSVVEDLQTVRHIIGICLKKNTAIQLEQGYACPSGGLANVASGLIT